jgi:hypothetical protein
MSEPRRGVTLAAHRLALGLELFDAARGGRVGPDLRVTFDELARGLARPPLRRHNSGLYALLLDPTTPAEVTLRVFDAGRRPPSRRDPDLVVYDARYDRRRFVPRRFTVPLPGEADRDDDPWVDGRARRPFLFPGAGYDVPDTATGVRGSVFRLLDAGTPNERNEPVRWVRVEATAPGDDLVVAWAHGDDRGEFLLLLPPLPAPLGDPGDPIEYRLKVFGGALPPPTDAQRRALALDALADLPVERFADPGADDDPVARGEVLPAGYAFLDDADVVFQPGRLISREFNV